ncbi:hypothetical protein ABT160_02630 [Streptomyces sp. NPDC001941]|uniref:hypothetical protein n=1 Tax=Streptomyces sp. NPDC001941 TaxID=3154659 RepID=UPI00331C6258
MGFINDAKAETAKRDAAKAHAAGYRTLVFKIIEANSTSRSTGIMTGVGEQIDAIEAQGWTLDTMTAAEGKALGGERVALVCLFRRRG